MASEKTIANGAPGNRSTGAKGAANGAVNGPGAGRPTGAADNVWDALTANPGATVATIAMAAQVSRATVARVLTAMEGDGRAVRTRGGWDNGKRRPDTWNAVTPDAPESDAHEDNTAPAAGPGDDVAATDTASQDEPGTGSAPNTTGGTDDGATTDGDGSGIDAAAVAEARDALIAVGAAIGDALAALDRGDGAAALTAAQTVYGGSGTARRLVRAVVNGRPRTATGRPRSRPGELRATVAAHLAANPGAEFSPHELGRALGRSAGAVSNALDRLVEAGEAVLVCERPRRFTVAEPAAHAKADTAR
jgi:DNA-binding MarR family transcriptional regulator